MPLELTPLARNEVRGIYGGRLAERMRWLAPEAALSVRRDLAPYVVWSDLYRSAESSLWAIQNRKGAARPGRSGHNYGWSGDIDIPRTMKRVKVATKRELDAWMAERGWRCHRRDGRARFEGWHYNFGIETFLRDSDPRTSWALERLLKATYGRYWTLKPRDIQRALASLRLYHGAIDGILGPLSDQAARAFQRTWKLTCDGIVGKDTQRTLAYVTAEKVVVPGE
jgi:hypothetical protein